MDELEIAMLGTLPKEEIEKIISELTEEERKQLATNPYLRLCPVCAEILAKDIDVNEHIVWREDLGEICSEQCIEDLAHNKSEYIREAIAYRKDLVEICSKQCIWDLAYNKSYDVRETVCHNKEVLEQYPDIAEFCQSR